MFLAVRCLSTHLDEKDGLKQGAIYSIVFCSTLTHLRIFGQEEDLPVTNLCFPCFHGSALYAADVGEALL